MKNEYKTERQPVDEVAERRQRLAERDMLRIGRKEAESKIEHLNLVFRAICKVNRLINKENDCDRLLEGVCDSLVGAGGCYNVWIALLDESRKLVTALEAGLGREFSPLLERLKRGELPDCGRKALRQPDVVVTEDPFSTCIYSPLSGKYYGRGALSVRLEYGGKVYGVLTASIPAHLTADEEEHSLFKEVTGDIALAVHSMKLEEVLQESQEFSSSLLSNSPNPILVINLDTSIRYVNPALEKLTGFSFAELIGRKVSYPWWTEETLPQTSRDLEEATQKRAKGLEELFQKRSGERFWVEITSTPVVRDGEFKYYISNWVDITERKQAEDRLKESEERLRVLFESISEGITVTDLDADIVRLNEGTLRLHGYSRKEELLGRSALDLIAEKDHARAMENMRKTFEEGRVGTEEYTFLRKDGREFSAELSADLVRDSSGNPIGFVAVTKDITERKIVEARLLELYETEKKQREELEEEAQARSQFINVLAHELRTPLTSLVAGAALLKDTLTSDPESREYRLADLTLNGARTLSSRLDELLDLARLSIGAFTLTRQSIDIGTFLEEIVSRFQPLVGEKGQSIILDIPQDLPAIEADRSRLEQVLMNLLSNASKFSPGQGGITLRARTEGSELVIKVEDQGLGLAPEQQERIFKPYHRVEQDRHRFPGLGLGLAVSKEIVQAHGGRMGVTSQLGQGSTFSFSLPLKGQQSVRLDI